MGHPLQVQQLPDSKVKLSRLAKFFIQYRFADPDFSELM